MVISTHEFYFMVFTGRCYTEVSIKIGYDSWSHEIEVMIILPLVFICIGYEFQGDYGMMGEGVPEDT